MIRSLAAPALALALLSAVTSAQETPLARVQVLKGRALLQAGETSLTLLRSQEHSTTGSVHLEVGAGSQVEVQWLGMASMQVWGPTSMDWSPTADASLAWSFSDLAWADVEVRRGEHRLDLPGDWRTSITGGALHLRGLPSGPVELRHHAGRALMLEWRGDAQRVRPPVAVYAGSSLRLDVPVDAEGSVRAWAPQRRVDEPGAPTPPPVEVHVGLDPATTTPTPESTPARTSRTVDLGKARQPEFIAPESVQAEVRRDDTRPRSQVREPLPPLHEAYQAAQEARETRSTERFTQAPSDPWRGVRTSEMTEAGPLVIERSSGLEVRVTAAGSWKVLLDNSATEPIWCFGPNEDVRISPGGVVTFASNGELRLKFGKVDVRQAPRGRVTPDLD